MRASGVAAVTAAAVGGYLVGRRTDELRVRLLRALESPTPSLEQARRLSYDTEYDHLADGEHEERHRIIEEMKRRPLAEREKRRKEPDQVVASRPLQRERDNRVAPRASI
jgi:hypothetical protein